MTEISIRKLYHSYHSSSWKTQDVLTNINLDIEKGDIVVILGISGCGKTTFLKILAGLLKPTSGEIIINNKKITSPHHSISYIFQQPCLLPWLNIKENIIFGCKIRKDKKNLNERVAKYIELMGLEKFEKAYPAHLSVGMAQRVAFARSLINNPEILLLDEPFTALDFYNRKKLQSALLKYWKKEKFTVIFVTHSIEEAILLGNKIVLLCESPSKIKSISEINYEYPRDLNNKSLFDLKIEIQDKINSIANKYQE